jgi:hypothetical protein
MGPKKLKKTHGSPADLSTLWLGFNSVKSNPIYQSGIGPKTHQRSPVNYNLTNSATNLGAWLNAVRFDQGRRRHHGRLGRSRADSRHAAGTQKRVCAGDLEQA